MSDKPALSTRDKARYRVHLAGVCGWATILIGITVVVLLATHGMWVQAGLVAVWWPLPVWGVINAVAPWWVRNQANKPSGGIFG